VIAPVGRDAGQILSEIRSLVEAGLQLDEVPGRPDDPSALVINGHRLVRRYTRGTPDYESALRQGMLERLPHTPPASTSAVEQAEELVGATLPGLVQNIFLDIANGGFGPAYGVLGVEHGFRDDLQRTAVDISKRRDEWLGMPDNLLPLCSWGCAIYSFVHCPSGRIFGWDPNPVDRGRRPVFRAGVHPRDMARCVAGRLTSATDARRRLGDPAIPGRDDRGERAFEIDS